jgi:hypothetical protein
MAKELTELEQIELDERKQALEGAKIRAALDRLQLAGLQAEHETKVNNKKRGIEDAKRANDDRKAIQARCNHHQGGEGALAVMNGQGDENRPTTIGAQVFLDDTIRLKCNRCGADCYSNDPDRAKWAYWVGLWKQSFTKTMMVIGGLKITKTTQPQLTA